MFLGSVVRCSFVGFFPLFLDESDCFVGQILVYASSFSRKRNLIVLVVDWSESLKIDVHKLFYPLPLSQRVNGTVSTNVLSVDETKKN